MKSKAKANADRAIKELKAARNKGVLVLKSSDKKQFYVHVGARNGEPLQHSETFTRKRNALKNILAVAKAYFGILSGNTAVHDEKGDSWVYQTAGPKKGKWVNTTVMMRKALLPTAVKIVKSISKEIGKDVVIRGPRGGVLVDTRKKKLARKQK